MANNKNNSHLGFLRKKELQDGLNSQYLEPGVTFAETFAHGSLVRLAYFFRLGVELHFSPAGMEWSFHSCRNGMVIPFSPEWSVHSIPAE